MAQDVSNDLAAQVQQAFAEKQVLCIRSSNKSLGDIQVITCALLS